MEYYELHVAGLIRRLPIIALTEKLSIASFVILGDCELITMSAPLIAKKLPPVDYLLTAEAKGIPLVNEVCRLLKLPQYIVARKSIKPYMENPIIDEVVSITTQQKQCLVMNGTDASTISGKRVAILDDVISTGESINGLERLAIKAGAEVVARAAILAEGDAAQREDILYLEKLPLFDKSISGKS
jgi:adenine phosphoribosyltransferase